MDVRRFSGKRVLVAATLFALVLANSAGLPRKARAATPEAVLPPGCDVLYERVSPDGRQVAYVGRYLGGGGEPQVGLFHVTLKTAEVSQLLETALKTAAAWSPDSTRLAIGNSPGYGNIYPLAIVDVASGEVDKTGVQGVGAAWSPDGRYVAVSTELHRGGSWSAGIPTDGRIGVWDVEKRTLSPVSPAGFNLDDASTGYSAMGGALRPVWSPDSRWIAYEQRLRIRHGREKSETHETWVVDREGKTLYRALAAASSVAWTDDSRALVLEGTDPAERIELASLEPVAPEAWPRPPAELVAVRKVAAEERARAAAWDPTRLFARNRPWQNPSFGNLESVQFTHRMTPKRLDERFLWRWDGVASLEVVAREDDRAESEVGRLWVTTTEPAQYRFGAKSRYAKRSPKKADEVVEYVRDHMMGTRTNFVALDWGREPGAFTLQRVTPDPAAHARVIELTPVGRRDSDRGVLNVGAMFETTSWAYVHHLRVARSEITVDEASQRIVREIDYDRDGEKICQIEFHDWLDVGPAESVPRRIEIEIPKSKFHVHYRFRWLPEGLWILEQGRSWFDGKEPQREELVDLSVNTAVPALDEQLAGVEQSVEALNGSPSKGERVALPVQPFVLGKRFPLGPEGRNDLFFTLKTRGDRFHHVPAYTSLWADIGLGKGPTGESEDDLLLVLYDDEGRPIAGRELPLAAAQVAKRPAAEFLQRIRERNALWLTPDVAALPDVKYAFRSRDQTTECSLDDENTVHRRGVFLSLALDALLKAPGAYKAPVLFNGRLGQKEVTVAVVTGPQFGVVFANGVGGRYRGYTSSSATQCLVVVEKETARPLLSRYGGFEIHFGDYVEVAPDRAVPLRISVLHSRGWNYDFHFQVIDDEVWLFDRSFDAEGNVSVSVDDILVDGSPPTQVVKRKGTAPPEEVHPADWAAITDRTPVRDGDNRLVRAVVDQPTPFEASCYELLGQIDCPSPGRLAIDLGRSKGLRNVASWSLNRRGGPALSSGEPLEAFATEVRLDTSLGVHASAVESPATCVRSIRLTKNELGEILGRPEIVSQDHMRELQVDACAVLLDEDSRAVAVADGQSTFRVMNDIHSSDDMLLNFGRQEGPHEPRRLLVGLTSVVVGAPLGSRWGSYSFSREPLFSPERLLAAEDPDCWQVGLAEIDRDLRSEVMRHELFDRYGRARGTSRQVALKPYLDRFQQLLDAADGFEGLALLCRLAGHSGDERFAARLAELLEADDSAVQDAAAIGLGMLGRSDGMARLLAILDRPMPADRDLVTELTELNTDTALALAEIGTDDAIRAVGRALVAAVDGIRVTPAAAGGVGIGGTLRLAERLTHILGRTRSPLLLPYIDQSLQVGDQSNHVFRDLVEAARQANDEAAVRDFFLKGIRAGNGEFLSSAPLDSAFPPAVGEMILQDDLSDWSFYLGVRYLKGVKSPASLRWLREAHRRRLHAEYDAGRVELAAALASYGDDRGLPDAFAAVARGVKLEPLPDDPDQRRREQWKRNRELTDDVDDMLMEHFPPQALKDAVGPKLESSDKATLLAALAVAEALFDVPAFWRPRIEHLAADEDEVIATAATLVADKWQD